MIKTPVTVKEKKLSKSPDVSISMPDLLVNESINNGGPRTPRNEEYWNSYKMKIKKKYS